MDTNKVLQAIKALLAHNSRENAEKLAKLVGLKLASNVFDINMNAGAGSGAIGRFATLTGDSENGQQALDDALALTGLPVDLPVVELKNMPLNVPMRYSLESHLVEVNLDVVLTRAQAAQAMAEEALHSIDHAGNGQTLSAGSRRMSLQRGDLALEAIKHFEAKGHFSEFLGYPLGEEYEYEFTPDRIKAELFARLGVLYFAQPELVKQVLPLAYEVFHGCFGLSKSSPIGSEYVRSKVWDAPRRVAQIRGEFRASQADGSGNATSTGSQPANNGLESLRATLAKALNAPSNGRKARL
jgi:hypothetical protein